MEKAEVIFNILKNQFGFIDAKGSLKFELKDFCITVEQNNVVGNILEEWLDKWMKTMKIEHEHNTAQESPDFWLSPSNKNSDWLEVKSFTNSPNFDVAAFRSFINLIIEKPWKLHSKYFIINYTMNKGIVVINNFWLKNLWEICSTSARWPLKVQYKNKVIVNIRPTTWYSENTEYKPFDSMTDFLAALEETIYLYHETRSTISENWSKRLCDSYFKHYNQKLILPRWNDIKEKYLNDNHNA